MGIIWNWIVDNFLSQKDSNKFHELAWFVAGHQARFIITDNKEDFNEKREQIYAYIRGWT